MVINSFAIKHGYQKTISIINYEREKLDSEKCNEAFFREFYYD
jgi:hypothetical protein